MRSRFRNFNRAVRLGATNPDVAYVPVRTAAILLDVTRQRVYQLIDADCISARSFDGTILVNTRSIDARIAWKAAQGDSRE